MHDRRGEEESVTWVDDGAGDGEGVEQVEHQGGHLYTYFWSHVGPAAWPDLRQRCETQHHLLAGAGRGGEARRSHHGLARQPRRPTQPVMAGVSQLSVPGQGRAIPVCDPRPPRLLPADHRGPVDGDRGQAGSQTTVSRLPPQCQQRVPAQHLFSVRSHQETLNHFTPLDRELVCCADLSSVGALEPPVLQAGLPVQQQHGPQLRQLVLHGEHGGQLGRVLGRHQSGPGLRQASHQLEAEQGLSNTRQLRSCT